MARIVARFRHDEPGPKVDAAPADAVVVDVPEENRYELRLGDRRIGLAAYHRRDNRIAFTHTEVDAACEGRGFGTRLVQGALDDARARGLEIVPLCPFVAAYVKRHPSCSLGRLFLLGEEQRRHLLLRRVDVAHDDVDECREHRGDRDREQHVEAAEEDPDRGHREQHEQR